MRLSKKQEDYSWFAWYPIRVELFDSGEFQWVWLERVVRQKTIYGDYYYQPIFSKK